MMGGIVEGSLDCEKGSRKDARQDSEQQQQLLCPERGQIRLVGAKGPIGARKDEDLAFSGKIEADRAISTPQWPDAKRSRLQSGLQLM